MSRSDPKVICRREVNESDNFVPAGQIEWQCIDLTVSLADLAIVRIVAFISAVIPRIGEPREKVTMTFPTEMGVQRKEYRDECEEVGGHCRHHQWMGSSHLLFNYSDYL